MFPEEPRYIENFDNSVAERLFQDPRYIDYVCGLIRHGFDEDKHGFNKYLFASMVSYGAHLLYSQGEGLEIFLPENFTFERCGYSLSQGLLVVRGNVTSIENQHGGVVYVDGNVNYLKENPFQRGAITYITGDLQKLKDTQNLILIVCGQIHSYEVSKSNMFETFPSIYVFSPNSATVILKAFPFRYYMMPAGIDHDDKMEGAFTVDIDSLRDWPPSITKQLAVELCKALSRYILYQRGVQLDAITHPRELIAWTNRNILAMITAYNQGILAGDYGIDFD
jgi:hypothetical protein